MAHPSMITDPPHLKIFDALRHLPNGKRTSDTCYIETVSPLYELEDVCLRHPHY